MKKVFLLLLAFNAFAQDPEPQTGALRITWPLNRTVLQMGANNQASINIAGQHVTYELYPTFLRVRQLQYKLIKLDTKTGADVSEVTNGYEDINGSEFNNDIGSKDLRTFLKTITLPKGWYRLQVRIRRSFITGYKTIERQDVLFGVGDVYLIAGQSNAQGYQQENPNSTPNPNNGDDYGIIQNANNYDERNAVSVIDRTSLPKRDFLNPIKIEGFPINNAIKDANETTIGYSQKGFSKLEKKKSDGSISNIYPRGKGSWCWGPLGSKIVENQTDTPILFFNAAEANTALSSWADKYWIDDAGNYTLPPSWAGDPCTTLPCLNKATYGVYKQFRSSLQMYGHILGLKSILWHQGERDAQNNAGSYSYYTSKMNTLINQSRTDIGSNLSWLSSQVSYYAYLSGTTPIPVNEHPENAPTPLNLAQQAVWNAGSKKYAGVFTDDLGVSFRNPMLKIHFTSETLKTVGDLWYAKNPTQATPTEGKTLLNLNVAISGTKYRLTAPTGYAKYFWVENENGIYSPLNSDLNLNYYDVDLTQSGTPKFITCYAGESTGEDMGNATDGWNLKLRLTQPFIIPGYENASADIATSKSLLAYNSTGGNNSFVLSSTNINWEALENTPWLSFVADEDLNGGEGNYPITVSVQPNTSIASRVAYLTIQQEGGGLSESVEVYQEGISDCNTALNLTSPLNDYTISATKKTATTIQATNKLQVNGTRIDYKAGNSITLNPGFKAENGVVFYAQIEGCIADTPWLSSMIGSVQGTTNINNGTLTIEGTGNVANSADYFQFYNKTFSGDVTVIARITNITAIDGMRGGIMFRSNTNQNSKMYELILDGNANAGKIKRRNASENAIFVGYATMPTSNTWLKMVKTNNTILCFVSSDGNSWNEIAGWDNHSDNDLGTSFLVGFIGYNSDNSQNCTVTFDNMNVNGIPVN